MLDTDITPETVEILTKEMRDKGIRLTKGFFDENPIKELSAAQFTYFQIVTLNLPGFNNQIAELTMPIMERERREAPGKGYEQGPLLALYLIHDVQ